MRKVYYEDTPQRKRLKQEAILILRQTRGLIDHALLDQARQHINQQMQKQEKAAQPPEPVADNKVADPRFEVIDRQKNLTTILKFIEMKSDNQPFLQEVRSILQQANH